MNNWRSLWRKALVLGPYLEVEIWKKVYRKHTRHSKIDEAFFFKKRLEVEMCKKGRPLWREAYMQEKKRKYTIPSYFLEIEMWKKCTPLCAFRRKTISKYVESATLLDDSMSIGYCKYVAVVARESKMLKLYISRES